MDRPDYKKAPFLFLTKREEESNYKKIEALPIYNINDLTYDELKILIQNFFESDNYEENHFEHKYYYYREHYILSFKLKNKIYVCSFIGEIKNDFKNLIIKFFKFLENIEIEELYLHYFDNDVDIINLIGNVIKNSNMITTISFSMSILESNNASEILCSYIKNHQKLGCLKLGFRFKQKLNNKCLKNIANLIKSSNIKDIYGLSEDDHISLFEILFNNYFLDNDKNIQFLYYNLKDDHVFKLSKIIKEKNINYLEGINLSSNNITSKGFSILIDSLLESKNENIKEIYMRDNDLDDDCIENLCKLIKQNKNIERISLGENNITDKGVEKLSEYIIGNTFIKSINLNHNLGITDNSFEIIKNMVKLSSISFFYIRATKISQDFIDEIIELLKVPIDQREIPLITNFDVKSASKRMKKEEI